MNSWPEYVLGQYTPGGKRTLCYNGIYFQRLGGEMVDQLWQNCNSRVAVVLLILIITADSFVIVFQKTSKSQFFFLFGTGSFCDISHWNLMGFSPLRLSNFYDNKHNSSFNYGGIIPVWFQTLSELEIPWLSTNFGISVSGDSSLVSAFINTPEVILMRVSLRSLFKAGSMVPTTPNCWISKSWAGP